MPKNLKLKEALNRHKGVDHKLERQKKLQKEAEKKKRSKKGSSVEVEDLETAAEQEEDIQAANLATSPAERRREKKSAKKAEKAQQTIGEADGWETDDSEAGEEDEGGVGLGAMEDESDSDSEEDFQNGNAEDDEEDIPLSDIESLASEDRGDVIPHQRLTINNTAALQRSLKAFALPSSLPFSATQSVTSAEPVQIADVEDDLNRELAFYRQSLDAVTEARAKLKKEGVPFTRPTDYFAEMVKSEEQMGKVRSKLLDETARKKASADARRQRDLKKFGKAVQVAKLQERQKETSKTLDRIQTLKRTDTFDVAVEDAATTAASDRATRRAKGAADGEKGRKRQKKDEKFGFGGRKKWAKSNDAKSTGDLSGYSVKKMKGGGKPRPGKSKRTRA
ncbi:uncharacterized protein MYCGRDRAFT_99446 [Zymoseptoria tritici IPO323]|uniref:Uncharacterized protein n=1 Tax=Zymoseptoria tritici (strain CBS 115943 / IPO323) TaxID=336722 RepID=F9X5H9_ZYMTI|nr:uncharacterized protein MYCGRDRAFT_99446 [Zymoseptoria tritici IPO323]EGP88686.1 hypothetical protein MYCGRDRAFT_99446 [Zymoseptoria tritici IPO323]